MLHRISRISYGVLIAACCLLPLAALAATLYLDVPAVLSALVAVLLLIPLARALLSAAAQHPRR